MAAGLLRRVPSEWRDVYVRGAWACGPAMPLVGGIGRLPLLRWLLLPPFALALARRGERAR